MQRYADGERKLTAEHAETFSRYLNTSPAQLIFADRSEIPIVGLAGAGPEGSVAFAEGDGNFGSIPAPTNSTPDTVAIEVRGHSMTGIANDGWLITYDEKRPPMAEMLGEPCVVWLANGRVLVKTLQRGSAPGLYNLESTMFPTMVDVVVDAAALVTNIMPRRAAERYIRTNPGEKIEDIPLLND